VKRSLLIALLVAFSSLAGADTYKWINEQGVVTYSKTPPRGIDAERIKLRSTGVSDEQGSRARLDSLRQSLADSAEDREMKKQEQEKMQKQAAAKAQNCEAARSNLQTLEGLGTRLYQADGEYKRLSEEKRLSLMAEAREQIKANCGP